MKEGLASWFALRTPRERLMLLVGGVVVVCFGLHMLVWQPLLAHRAALTSRLAQLDRAVDVLARAPIQSVAAATDDRPLNVVLTETSGTFDLVIRRLEPEGDRMRLVLDEAPFDRVLLWVETLERERGIRLAAAELVRRPAPGVVSVNLVVERRP